MFDPVTIATIGGLATTSKTITELLTTIKDASKKVQLENAKSQIDLAKAQLEAVARDKDELKRQNEDLRKENKDLAEKVAFIDLTQEFDIRDSLCYRKGTGGGPFCSVDRYPMTFHGHAFGNKKWKCPEWH